MARTSGTDKWHGQVARTSGTDKWHGVEWYESPLGNPIIAGSLHWLACEIYAEHGAGDHLIVIGEVKALDLQEATTTQPLLYFKGQYRSLAAHSTV